MRSRVAYVLLTPRLRYSHNRPTWAADAVVTPTGQASREQGFLYRKVQNRRRRLSTMSWRSHGKDNDSLVSELSKNDIVKTTEVIDAMKAVDRGLFVPSSHYKTAAYQDSPQSIGYGVTISAPHMHGYCLELLAEKLVPGSTVLDVGSGSGYLTAIFAMMTTDEETGRFGKAIGIEHISELVESSISSIKNSNAASRYESGALKIIEGDGYKGYKEHAPYTAIHVGAACPELPEELIEQLDFGGRLVVPVGRDSQHLLVIDRKLDGTVTKKSVMGVMYVPLTTKEEQLRRNREFRS